jgi:hypothetical protein
MLKEKAVVIADHLMPAFNTPSGIPKSLLNLATYVSPSSPLPHSTSENIIVLLKKTF